MQTNVPKIVQLYQDEMLSIEQIAEALHISSSSTVHQWLVRKTFGSSDLTPREPHEAS